MNTTSVHARDRGGKTTMRDVASEAGVSTAAVSKVLHGSRSTIGVSDSRALHIRETAERMGYVPNRLARGLRSGRTGDIGLVFEGFGGLAEGPRYYALALDGIAEILFERGFRFTLLPDVTSADAVASLSDGRLDGAIWCRVTPERAASVVGDSPIPIVALNASPSFAAVGSRRGAVQCDNAGGARAAARHLFDLGHRRCGFVDQFARYPSPDATVRGEAFRAEMLALGAEEPVRLTWSDDCAEFADWHRTASGITALFAWNEGAAGAILHHARQAGVRIPEDLSVVGFDSTSYCDTTTPPLTAVHQPVGLMARHAARLLIAMIEGETPSDSVALYDCSLDIRRSTGPTPRS